MLKVLKNFGLNMPKDAQGSSNQFNKFSERSSCLVLSCEGEDIEWCSKNVNANLGYRDSELTKSKVTALMPSLFARCHDELVRRWINFGREVTMGRLNPQLCQNRNGFLSPATIAKKILPSPESIRLLGVIQQENY